MSAIIMSCAIRLDGVAMRVPRKHLPLLNWPMSVIWPDASRKSFDLYRFGDVLPSARQAQVWKEFSRRDHLTVKQLFQIIKRTDHMIGQLCVLYYAAVALRLVGHGSKYKSETYYDKAD